MTLLQMFDNAQRLLPADELREKFQQAGRNSGAACCSTMYFGIKERLLQNTKHWNSNGIDIKHILIISITYELDFFLGMPAYVQQA
jgi:hypothetical protein